MPKPYASLIEHYKGPEEKQTFLRKIFDESAPHYESIARLGFFGSGQWYRRDADQIRGWGSRSSVRGTSAPLAALGAAAILLFALAEADGADRRAWAAYKRGEYRRAIAMLTNTVKANRSDALSLAHAYFERGIVFLNIGNMDRAIADFDQVIRRVPTFPGVWAERGIAHAQNGNFAAGFRDCDEAIRLDAKNALAYALRADIARLAGQPDRALKEAAIAIKLNPRLARPYQVQGRVFDKVKRYDDAIRAYTQAIRLNPNWDTAIAARADSYYEKGDFKTAEQGFREAVARVPHGTHSHNGLAWFLATCPDPSYRNGREALIHARKACELTGWRDSNDVAALAAAYAEVEDFPSAIAHVSRALRLGFIPDDDRKHRSKELSLYKQRKPRRWIPGE